MNTTKKIADSKKLNPERYTLNPDKRTRRRLPERHAETDVRLKRRSFLKAMGSAPQLLPSRAVLILQSERPMNF